MPQRGARALVYIVQTHAAEQDNGETAVSIFKNPFDPSEKLHTGCGCGRHASAAEHDAALARDAEALQSRAVENAVVRALFPHDETRRNFLRAVGSGTARICTS